ncbi:MAG: 2-hydroxyacid dehydrogenase [Anaerofustis sp.]
MTKVLILTSEKRVRKFYDLSSLPSEWELIYAEGLKTDDEILKAAPDADYIFADAIREVSANLIANMSKLKLIHSEGVAFNKIDTAAAKAHGVFVCNNAAANAVAVAEHTVMLMLAMQRRLLEGDMMVRSGRQIEAKGAFILDGINELNAAHVGLIGFGMIAKETAKRLKAFGCKVSCFHSTPNAQAEQALGVDYLALDELLRSCDIISLHLPVTSDTVNYIDATRLAVLKPNAILINTARGELIDQQALAKALEAGQLAGAAFDTLTPEPVTKDNPLLKLSESCRYKVLFSPHIAGTTLQAFQTMHKTVWSNILAVENGKQPINICNP